MKRLCRSVFLGLALTLAATALPARADFYTLEGRFQCLDRPNAVCFDATTAPVAEPVAAPRESRDSTLDAAPLGAAAPPTRPAPAAATGSADPVLAIARRIARERPDEGDLGRLRRAADSGDGRAIELLAWCALKGIGTGRDPVEAYLLYGKAAASAVPQARENQRLIYEHTLTSAERQRVLDLEARPRRAPGTLAASAPAEGARAP